MGRVCHRPSLYGPSLLWAEFVMGRVCYGPSCPVTDKNIIIAFFFNCVTEMFPYSIVKIKGCLFFWITTLFYYLGNDNYFLIYAYA